MNTPIYTQAETNDIISTAINAVVMAFKQNATSSEIEEYIDHAGHNLCLAEDTIEHMKMSVNSAVRVLTK